MPSNERLLLLNDLVDAVVGMECGLNGGEDDDRAVSASTAISNRLK